MKTKIFLLTILLFGVAVQESIAQCSAANHNPPAANYLGFNFGANLNFATNATSQMTLTTNGDLDVLGITNGYQIGGTYALWYGSGGGSANLIVGQTPASPGGSNNTVLGSGAGSGLLPSSTGGENTFVGVQTGDGNGAGSNNTASGYQAFFTNTTGSFNDAEGVDALYGNSMGNNNIGMGYQALYANSSGNANIAVGPEALYNTTGTSNAAYGFNALFTNTTGWDNTAIGDNALGSSHTASSTTAIGNYSGYNNLGSFNVFLGDSAGLGCNATTYTNVVCIGYNSGPPPTSMNSDYVFVGNSTTTHISSAMAIITTWSDRRIKDNIQANVPGLDFITKITPVTYHYNLSKAGGLLGTSGNSGTKSAVEQITQSGFIAQQVDSAAQACGYDFSGVVRPQNPNGLYSIAYSEFVVPLVKSVQELNTKNQTLSSTVDSLRSALQSMQTCLNQICAATGNNNANATPASEQNVTLNSANSPVLYQNSPNPFNTGTKINYYLPEGTMGATIVFYDTYGNQIKTIQLNQTGNGTLTITPDNLTNGIYSYSLIVNNTVVDTKKMVLQK